MILVEYLTQRSQSRRETMEYEREVSCAKPQKEYEKISVYSVPLWPTIRTRMIIS